MTPIPYKLYIQCIRYFSIRMWLHMAAKRSKDKNPDLQASKRKRLRLIWDSFTMPENDFLKIKALKNRCLKLGIEMKKSELLRAGLTALKTLKDAEFQSIMITIEKIKTGRPPN